MVSLIKTLSPTCQNPIQRTGFFTSLFLASLVLFIHFPFNGYNNEYLVITRYGEGPCPNTPSIEELRKMSVKQINSDVDQSIKCQDKEEMQTIPFFDWDSKDPIIEWFGPTSHAAISLFFVFFLGAIWLWVFRKNDNY